MKQPFLIVCLLAIGALSATAQSNLKEGNNNFALYSKNKDFKYLEAARKFADEAYKTKRDSSDYKNNLLRGLVYSTLAVVDSNRTQKYTSDPIDVARAALKKLNDPQLNYESEPEINYIRRSLATAHLLKARRALNNANNEEALYQYLKVDSISRSADNIKHNLAVLSAETGNKEGAIQRYQTLINERETSSPVYVLELATLYKQQGDTRQMLNTLLTGREQFPDSKEILFALINTYVANDAYSAIVPLADEALGHEPDNVNLNYIAGYANEVEGNVEAAKKYYEKVIDLDGNNFQGNFELGLIYLKEYVADPDNADKQNKAQEYLLRANQIRPSETNALKSLAVLYNQSGNVIQLERVNNILNQLIID